MKKVLIVDYIVGGGFSEEDLPIDRLSEGYAIFRALIEQFSLLGYKVSTLIDQRLMQHIRVAPIHDFISISTTEEFISGLTQMADKVDYTITNAPESKGILKDLSTMMINSKSLYLGSSPEAIEIAADKLKTMEVAKKINLNVPATFAPSYSEPIEKISQDVSILGYPLIVKPIDGISCQGLTKVTNLDDLHFGIQLAHSVSNMEQCIIQEFIQGTPISVSLLANDQTVYPISINHQNLRIESSRSTGKYIGGEVPFSMPEHDKEIIDTSIELVSRLKLKGFVGVDLIVSDEGIFVIEVNPRITIPFITLKEISSQNIAQLLIDVFEQKNKEIKIKINSYASFSKIMVPIAVGKQMRYEKVAGIDGVLSPPFPIGKNSHSYALIMGVGKNIDQARKDYQRVKNQLLETITS